jgi:hypothetical protein
VRIPRSPLLPVALALFAPAARPAEPNEEVVKAVRAMLDEKKEEVRDELKAALLKRPDLDWASVKAGLEAGPYYQKPLVTAYGLRYSNKHMDLVFSTVEGSPRGFLLYVPKSYEAQPTPLIVYLHDGPDVPHVNQGGSRAETAVLRFKEMCEEKGIMMLAPYTSKGAEWWTPVGRRLVEWALRQVRQRFNIDDDRVGLLGALGGGDGVWYLGQEMPGTWSVLMPMTGDPYEITAIIRPLFLGTLDRMDVLMGVPGKTLSHVGEKDQNRFLSDLNPLFGQRMRITTAVYPTAHGDFSYLEQIAPQIASFVLDRKRKPYPEEVDVEVDEGDGLRSLWLRNDGYDASGFKAPGYHGFKETRLKWTPPERKEQDRKVGLQLDAREGTPGLFVNATPGEAKNAQIFPGDVLLEADGVVISKVDDLKAVLEKHEWEEEVKLLLARDLKESELKRHERVEEQYKRFRRQIEELRAKGEEVPRNLWESMAEEEPEEEEGCAEEEEAGISVSDDAPKGDGARGPKAGPAEKKFTRIVERWVTLRRSGGVLVRADFGADRDVNWDKAGVKIQSVYAGSLAARSGLKDNDVIVQVGDTAVNNIHDIERYFATVDEGGKPFRFEEEPDGKNAIEFTVRQPNNDGTFQNERTVVVRWSPVRSSRVDGKWDKAENTLRVLSNDASGFTLYFTDELIEAGKEFHLFVNDVPYQDLVDPENAPEYPRGDDAKFDRERSQRKRATVPGWTPDPAFAIEEFLESWDRRQVYGAKRSFDLTKVKAAHEKARARAEKEHGEQADRIRKAYEEYRERAKG